MGVLCKLLTYAVIIMKSMLVYSFNFTLYFTHIYKYKYMFTYT